MRAKNEDNVKRPFGEKVVVLGGDLRQNLSVVKKGQNLILWKHQ